MASQAIATVAAVLGTAFARNENGELREIKAGDVIYEGEVLVTPDGSSVELSMMDGSPLVVSGVQETLLTPDVVAELAATAQEAAANQETLDELISGIRGLDTPSEEEQILQALEGDGNLDDLLEETAAGLSGGGQTEGHSFVLLDRVNEEVAFDGTGVTDGNLADTTATQENDVNLPPQVANVNLGEIEEDGSITFTAQDLLFGSFDPEGVPLTVSNVTLTSGDGTLTDNGDGTFTFTPEANWNGDVSFGFDVTDDLITVPNTATLNVTPVNDAPEVGPITIVDTEVTASDGSVIVGIPEDGSLIITEEQLIG
ncbi:MAG TPA: retention module-containing protein, partial [Pseudomonadales bacterium]|nr:retention module-containing protein [Pseudomonadales bacterium]